jgi:hypothetical protein
MTEIRLEPSQGCKHQPISNSPGLGHVVSGDITVSVVPCARCGKPFSAAWRNGRFIGTFGGFKTKKD